eukprot:gene4560-6432_t
MNLNLTGTDGMVGEYLIYRGFTQTFQCLESEKNKDRTKRFEINRIVESILAHLHNFEIESFVSLWDFLSKRFFLHLDQEHLNLCGLLKSDLLKYYLVHAIKTRNKDKVTEFFTMYSHEILAEGGDFIPGNLRAWFALPYMEDPEKDTEYSVYFSVRWSDLLKNTLHNFLSIVLSTAPPPKLLLLDRWFRSEAQQELRSQLKLSSKKIDVLINKLEKSEDRLREMQQVLRDLVTYLHKEMNMSNALSSKTSTHVGLFETDEEAETKRNKIKELGQIVSKLSSECVKKSQHLESLPRDKRILEILGKESAAIFSSLSEIQIDFFDYDNQRNQHTRNLDDESSHQQANNMSIEEVENELIKQLQIWLKVLAV